MNSEKVIVLDSIGCALSGYASKPSAIMRNLVNRMDGNPESTIVLRK